MIDFDRKDKCPICNHWFMSDKCKHSFGYVFRVLEAANSDFHNDVEKVKKRRK